MSTELAIRAAIALLDLLAQYRINVRELTAEWEASRAEGRDADVERFKQQALSARQRVLDQL